MICIEFGNKVTEFGETFGSYFWLLFFPYHTINPSIAVVVIGSYHFLLH